MKTFKSFVKESIESSKAYGERVARERSERRKGGDRRTTGPTNDPKDSRKRNLDRRKSVNEVSPPGWSGTVKAMKKHKNISNPFALAWSMKNKGAKSHIKAEDVAAPGPTCTSGSGAVAGTGGKGGEPGVTPKKKPVMSFYRRKQNATIRSAGIARR